MWIIMIYPFETKKMPAGLGSWRAFFNSGFLTSATCSLDLLRYCRTAAPQQGRTAGIYAL
jgi:hypothetical protein